MKTADRALSPPTRQPLLNRAMTRVLRSPAAGLVDRGVMIVTVYGRRTGQPYTLPVQYTRDGEVLWVVVGSSAQKTWWRNLRDDARVDVVLRRRVRHGRGRAHTCAQQRETVEEGLRRYRERFPRMARGLGLRAGDEAGLARVAPGVVVVRIELHGGPAPGASSGPRTGTG